MKISLLDDSLIVEVFYEKNDSEYDDNVCIAFTEPCDDDQCIFRAGETYIYLTSNQARELGQALIYAAGESDLKSRDS